MFISTFYDIVISAVIAEMPWSIILEQYNPLC